VVVREHLHLALNRYLAVKGELNPANALIIYAWNEHDEGGWLMPTLGVDGRANEERMKAV
jgi:hypothetical protein